jgi:hypothetical protein
MLKTDGGELFANTLNVLNDTAMMFQGLTRLEVHFQVCLYFVRSTLYRMLWDE